MRLGRGDLLSLIMRARGLSGPDNDRAQVGPGYAGDCRMVGLEWFYGLASGGTKSAATVGMAKSELVDRTMNLRDDWKCAQNA